MKVKCQWCGEKEEKNEMIQINGKNFHKDCAVLFQERRILYDTIMQIFNYKAPGPANLKLVKDFIEQGYTYKGITQALIYHFNVQKGSVEKAQGRIGIVPYVYDEAQEYFIKKNIQIQTIQQRAEILSQQEQQYNLVRAEPLKEKRLLYKKIDFVNPFDVEEE